MLQNFEQIFSNATSYTCNMSQNDPLKFPAALFRVSILWMHYWFKVTWLQTVDMIDIVDKHLFKLRVHQTGC